MKEENSWLKKGFYTTKEGVEALRVQRKKSCMKDIFVDTKMHLCESKVVFRLASAGQRHKVVLVHSATPFCLDRLGCTMYVYVAVPFSIEGHVIFITNHAAAGDPGILFCFIRM